jgi:signal transduction histidine kinase
VPIAAAALPGVRGLIGSPAFANIMLGMLLFASAAVGLAAALSGLAQVGQSLARAGHEPEQAVSRIFVLALLFGYAAAIAVPNDTERSASFELPLTAAALAAAWLLLLHILLQPAPSAVRRACGMVLDAAVVSALLHCGGETTAGWYPLYLLATCYAGFRFGVGALLWTAMLNLLGFAAVVASTEFWQQQPALTAGLILALIVLPALVAAPLRERAASQAAAIAATRAKLRFVRVMTETLQPPPATAFDAASELDHSESDLVLLRLHTDDILALAAIEAENFAPRSEAFDLHALVNDTLGSRSRETATEGIALRWRIDPYLPYRVYGWRQPFERALRNLLDHAIATSEGGAVRVGLAALGADAERVRLALTIDCAADPAPAAAAVTADPLAADDAGAGGNEFGVALARRIVELMGGRIRVDAVPPGQTRYTAEIDLAIDRRAADTELDLADHPVLTVTGDREFAGDVVEALDACNADVRWIGEAEAALEYIAWVDPAVRAVLLVDGRSKPLSAVGFVDRVRVLGGAAPLILFIAEPGQISGLAELETGEFDALLPRPAQPAAARQRAARAALASRSRRSPGFRGTACRPVAAGGRR